MEDITKACIIIQDALGTKEVIEILLKNNKCHSMSSLRDAPLCRICHEGDENEDLLSPCFCSGTVGALHMSCLEQWLGTSDKTRCEICEFQFSIAKKPKPMTWFLRNKALGQERRYMIADIGCAVCFTPFTIGSVTGCLVGAQYFTSVNKDWQATTLILLAMTNLLIFLLWCWFTARRNYILCSTWRENFQEIKIKYNPPDKNNKIRYNPDKNNNTQTINRGTSVTERTLLESSFPGKIISPNKHKSRKVSYEQSPGINQSKVHVEEAENSTLKPGTPYPKRKHSSTCDQNIIHPENHIEMIQIEEETKVLTDQDKQRLRQMQLYKIGNTSTSTPTISSVIMKKHTIFDETHCCATPIQYPWGTPVVVNDHPDHPGMFVQTPYTLVKSNMAASSMAKRGLLFQKSPKAAIQNNFEIPVEKGLDKD